MHPGDGPVQPGPTPQAAAGTTVVQAGDGWIRVAQRALGDGNRFRELQALNGGPDRVLHPGDVLVLPGPATPPAAARTTVVQAGDGWIRVAQRALGDGNRFRELQALNGGPDRVLHPGDVLVLPA